jgi:hypothetical protein
MVFFRLNRVEGGMVVGVLISFWADGRTGGRADERTGGRADERTGERVSGWVGFLL